MFRRVPRIQNSSTHPAPSLADFDDQRVLEIAERHLADLAARQRTVPAEVAPTRMPRLRRLWRRVVDVGVKLLDVLEIVGRFLIDPRHIPGRWLARLRLLQPTKTFNLVTFATLLFAAALGFQPDWRKGALTAVMGSLFTGTVLGLLILMWDDLARCPYRAAKIRRQIRRRPNCVTLDDIGRHAVSLVEDDKPIEIVPRTDLFDELTPGVLQRKRKDVQIVVGDPGAGKTTALIGVAERLAKLGIVPVMVRLHSDADIDLAELGRRRFKQQIGEYVRTDVEAETLWQWLHKRRRVALLADDIDRLSPDGERGFMLRNVIAEVQTVDLPIVVTARPAGVPAGIAASAIYLDQLDERRAIDCVAEGARHDASFRADREVSRDSLARWVRAGRLAEVPYYLELLAQLAAAGRDTFKELGEPWSSTIAIDAQGLFERGRGASARWNRWWVHFQLIDHYYDEVCAGHVRRWTGIEVRERTSTMEALQDAALGVLLAGTLGARAKLLPRAEQAKRLPERTQIADFIRTDDRNEHRRPTECDARVGGGWAAVPVDREMRPAVSASEVIETAERLRILDRDAQGEPQFRHRITQAYLAARRLAELEVKGQAGIADWIELLLDHRQPEKLTAQTALTFAALWADRERRGADLHEQHQDRYGANRRHSSQEWKRVEQEILRRLWNSARESLRGAGQARGGAPARAGRRRRLSSRLPPRFARSSSTRSIAPLGALEEDHRSSGPEDLDPLHVGDPEARRDPDDALIKLTTASVIAHATARKTGERDGDRRPSTAQEELPRECPQGAEITQCEILDLVRHSPLVTRWTKVNAIEAIAALDVADRWKRIWAYARDGDYVVRQAASRALQQGAFSAYRALETDVGKLIVRAAALSALDQELEGKLEDLDPSGQAAAKRAYYVGTWTRDDVLGLRALGTVLPAIVSGLQEDPSLMHRLTAWQGRDGSAPDADDLSWDADDDVSSDERRRYAGRARTALAQLVAISYQGGYHELERAVARGFRGDAVRHVAADGDREWASERNHAGPGWVAAHTDLVVDVGLCHAEDWYAQLVLGQALALYTIAGGSRNGAFDVFARCLHRGGAHRHPFTQRALRLARTAVRRQGVHSARWSAFLWEDEVAASHGRPVARTSRTAQLLGDVTVLLDLAEGAPEDRREASAKADELPYCLHRSRDRREILGVGCPPECGWNLCPYKQPPPDEPNEHRGVSRAFCRQQRWIASHHKVPWQRRIRRRRLAAFWQQMERRART
jgi:hypothetical protein